MNNGFDKPNSAHKRQKNTFPCGKLNFDSITDLSKMSLFMFSFKYLDTNIFKGMADR